MSDRRKSSAPLSSTSMRLPASSVKLGLKLEQYLSAIQRSESIRDANRFHAEFPVAPVDVTSKRHLFEKELVGQSREGPATSRKNQETQRDLAARSKPQWRKKPEALLGAEKPSAAGKTLEPKASLDMRPSTPVNAPCPRRSLCWRRELTQERGQFQAKPATWRRDRCLRKSPFEKTPFPEMQPALGRAMASVQRGTGPEMEHESSPGPLPRAGGLLPLTLQVCGAPHLPVLPASLAASPSSWHLWQPPCLLSSHLLSSWCLWLPPFLLSSFLQAGPSCVSPPCLLCRDRGLGWGLTWHPHHTLIPGPDSMEASDPCPLAWPWAYGCTPTTEAAGGVRGLACCHCSMAAGVSQACGCSRLPLLPHDSSHAPCFCQMDHVSGGQGAPTVCVQRPHSLCQSEVGHRGRPSSRPVFLPCSTRMRLPASSVKLGLKVEQYLSAIQVRGPGPGVCWACQGPQPPESTACALCSQRSKSIRYANPFHTEFPVAPVDVTSKRHLFEKKQVGQSQEDPASSCKNRETQRELAAGSKPQWRKTPEAPLGAEVSSPSTEAEAKSPSPTVALPTFSSSLQHSSPHTISFRMSPRRDSSEAALTRSTRMRLPASSVKLGLKVEQYLSAIQRSKSIRYANPFHTEFPVAPVDVTSKRHLFEKKQVGQSQEDPASSCKKISVLEERAVSGKRAVPDKASDSEKRPVSEKATVFEKTPVPEMQPAPGRAMAPVWPQDWEHSASAEYPSSPTRQRGTGPEKEPESSAGPLSRAGGLPPVTLQVSSPSTEAEAKSPSLVGQSRGPSLQRQAAGSWLQPVLPRIYWYGKGHWAQRPPGTVEGQPQLRRGQVNRRAGTWEDLIALVQLCRWANSCCQDESSCLLGTGLRREEEAMSDVEERVDEYE
ncbi:hypothetical protein R6Z07F_001168 [Ovis aries]